MMWVGRRSLCIRDRECIRSGGYTRYDDACILGRVMGACMNGSMGEGGMAYKRYPGGGRL